MTGSRSSSWSRVRRWFSDLEAHGVHRLRDASSAPGSAPEPDSKLARPEDLSRDGALEAKLEARERAAAAQILWLTKNLPVADRPAVLESPEFLEGILDHAVRASEPVVPLDALFRSSAPPEPENGPLARSEAPEAAMEKAFPHLHEALEHWGQDPVPAPAEESWQAMAAGLQHEAQEFRRSGSRVRRRRAGMGILLAASLVLASLYGIRGGTPELDTPVFVELDRPPVGDMFGIAAVRKAAAPL